MADRFLVDAPHHTILADRREWRTVLLAVAVYGGWAGAIAAHRVLPWWAVVAALAWFGAWHMSLQHETIHGHPFRDRRLGHALGWLPLTLWLPYELYRTSHLAHHAADLTDPVDDPESYYLTAERYARCGALGRALHRWNRTMVFRLVVWSAVSIAAYVGHGLLEVVRRRPGAARTWLAHTAGAAGILAVALGVAGVPAWEYVLGAVYAARALNLVRSFAEHRWSPDAGDRTAIVAAGPVMRLLNLNLNLHLAHHEAPGLAWYLLPGQSERTGAPQRAALGAGFYPGGYAEVVRRYAFAPFETAIHPTAGRPGRAEARRAST